MLDAYIIDAIRKEELEREQAFEHRRVWLEIPRPLIPLAPLVPPDREMGTEDDETTYSIVVPLRPEVPPRDADEDAA